MWCKFVVSVAANTQQATFQVVDPHLVYSLTTDMAVYLAGDPVQITFTETNTGDQPVTIDPELVMFNVMHDGNWIWGDGSPWSWSHTRSEEQRGEKYSKTVTWDGIPSYYPIN